MLALIVLNVLLTVVSIYLYAQLRLDSYTGLLNKEQFNQAVKNMKRKDDVVVVIDIDKFKLINDSRGHSYGDLVIANVASTIKDNIRSSDRAYRIGGDEFAIIRNEAGTADRVREQLRVQDIYVSVGCGKTCEEADKSMYANKQGVL